jgi:hypothetical protein
MICCYVFCKKSNEEIHTKLSFGYNKDALCQRTVNAWTARFRSERISVEDDDRPGRSSSDDFSTVVSGYLERNSYASCRKIAKDLFVLMTMILRVLEEISSRFFIARWMLHELSAESNANRVDICQEMLEILEKLGPRQKNHVITSDECWIY